MNETSNEKYAASLTAQVIVIVALIIVVGSVLANKQNRELERQMAEQGYEQNSVPGETGTYWVKAR